MAVPLRRAESPPVDGSERVAVRLLQLVLLVVLVILVIEVGLPALLDLAGAPFR